MGALVALSAMLGSGCESSQEKSRRLQEQAQRSLHAAGVRVGAQNSAVVVERTSLLRGSDGWAVAALLRNRSTQVQSSLPVSIALRDRRGRIVFRNDAPGLERSLTHVARIDPGQQIWWVNDQAYPTATPVRVEVKVGAGRAAAAAARAVAADRAQVEGVTVVRDPVSGWEAVGTVRSAAGRDLREVIVTCVALRAGRVVAAGRARIERLRGNKPQRFHAFLLGGDPRGARVAARASAGGGGA